MVKPKQDQTRRRTPGPKSKPKIPEKFQISRQINPMSLILNEAETAHIQPPQNLNPDQNLPLLKSHRLQPEAGETAKPAVKSEPPAKKAPAANSAPAAKTEPGKGFLPLPNELLDLVFPELDHAEVVIYLRLFRLSYGFGQQQCRVSIATLAKRCNCSENTVRATLKKLIGKGLIRTLTVTNTGAPDGGTTYQVFTRQGGAYQQTPGAEIEPAAETAGGTKLLPAAETAGNKDHDHDHEKTDHHQSAVMTIYRRLTGNSWQQTDQVAYQKIREIPLETIEQAIKITSTRATTRPNSLAYFVKEIQHLAHPNKQTRTAQKKALAAVIDRVRSLQAGGNYAFADFVEDVKRACVRAGVIFDSDLFNEILSI